MSSMSRLFLQKAFFTFLILISLSSFLSAMEEDHEFNGEEKGKTATKSYDRENEVDLFKPTPPSSILGKSTRWIWNNVGAYIDYGIIGATTYVGASIGSAFDSVVARCVGESVGARPITISYNHDQYSLLSNERILQNTRINTLNAGTFQFGFPYDDLATAFGAATGYFVGKGIVIIRQSSMDMLIQCYPPVKNWCLNTLFSIGWKIADIATALKEE